MSQLLALDNLDIDVLLDNLTDSYSSKPANVIPEFQNVLSSGHDHLSGTTLCCAQLGLSLMLTGYAGGQKHKLLFDAGPEGAITIRNCENLGVTLKDVEAIAISHGHWDHMGALLLVIDAICSEGRQKVPCHVNPGMFLERGARLADGRVAPFENVPTPEQMSDHGADVINEENERFLLDNFFYLSDEIPRVSSFEKGRTDHLCRENSNSPWRPDPYLLDERYLAALIKGKGLIVFSACSHAGIINVLEDLRARFPEQKIFAVFGGLHLVGPLESIIGQTVEKLGEFNPAQIVPAHCTGFRALHALLNAFGEEVVLPCAVGSKYKFAASEV